MQEILLFVFSGILGYLAGAGFRWGLGRVVPGGNHCNIHKKGQQSRFILSLILLTGGILLKWPILVFFAGFTLYESHKKWCLMKSN